MPSEASVKFFGEAFFQKSFDLALDLSGRQPEKKPANRRRHAPVRAIATGAAGEAGSLPSPPSFGGHLPQRGRRDLAPPLGELAAVRRLRGQAPARRPAGTPVSPRRRLYQRAAHAWARLDRKARCANLCRPWRHGGPPARVLHLKMSHRDIFSLSCAC